MEDLPGPRRRLRDDGVAEGVDAVGPEAFSHELVRISVHPSDRPIIHSTKRGLRRGNFPPVAPRASVNALPLDGDRFSAAPFMSRAVGVGSIRTTASVRVVPV